MSTATANRPTTQPPSPTPGRTRKGLRRAIIVTAIVVVLLAASGWVVYGSSFLATDRVAVHGARQVSVDQVVAVTQVPLGRPLARQDVEAIARRATTLPAVRSATVERRWPHTLLVTVVERQPLLAVRQPGGFIIVDREGVAYESRVNRPARAVIADVNPEAVGLLAQVGEVASAFPAALESKVATVRATNVDDIEVVLESGIVVRWGTPVESPLKAQLVLALLKERPKVSIDVSSPHNPAIR